MIEKNGNTLAPGDTVRRVTASADGKVAAAEGEVVSVDPDQGTVLVKFANAERWLPFSDIEKT